MKNITLKSLAILLAGTVPSFATVLVNYDFNSLSTASPLVGQDGWTQAGGGVSPSVAVGTSTVNYVGSNAASTATASGTPSMAYNIEFTAGVVTGSSIVRMEFDVYRPSGSPVAFLGIGEASGSIVPPYFGVSGNQFQVRAHNYGTSTAVSGALFNSGEWYRVAAEWNISTGLGTMYAKNLTDPSATAWQTNTTDAGGGWRQLYFGAGQTNPTFALGIPGSGTGSVANWNSAFIRTSPSGTGTSYLDNIYVTVVPEPGTSLLFGLAATSLFVFRRRRN